MDLDSWEDMYLTPEDHRALDDAESCPASTTTWLLPGAAAVCIDQLSYCILLLLTSTFIFQHVHVLEFLYQIK